MLKDLAYYAFGIYLYAQNGLKSHLLGFSDFLQIQEINVQIGLIVFTQYWKRNVAISEP